MGYKLTKILKQNAIKNCLATSQKLPNTSRNVSQYLFDTSVITPHLRKRWQSALAFGEAAVRLL